MNKYRHKIKKHEHQEEIKNLKLIINEINLFLKTLTAYQKDGFKNTPLKNLPQ